ncbi:hypothetical protein B0T24DRAFT_595061 [Lasiosphaeria ovina]|uniref:Uncharacterized protein n=1 Tax=Lasiosphaeria ovina TaxID=92902 RepID=A0AAE0N5S6_9PEZI|nr:hypothetical protein B0T24DRAFT_595061 [Lasiosphaeria ovina]
MPVAKYGLLETQTSSATHHRASKAQFGMKHICLAIGKCSSKLQNKKIKDGDGHEEQKGEQEMGVRVQKGEQKMSVRVISVDKGKGIDKGEEDKVSKLSLRGSYRKATDKFKRSRVASLFGIGEKRE